MSEIAVDNGLLLQVDKNVRVAINNIGVVNSQVIALQGKLAEAQNHIRDLQAFVAEMKRSQEGAATLQRAITEIVRVRQEIEQKYGKYQEVRDSMMGILQANDHALVTKSTISRISEELMISTPQYWLAPCVIAIAAWISNNKALADKAIDEALKRDLEKTTLLMAIVCRRAALRDDESGTKDKRMASSQKWLQAYFNAQDPLDVSRSVIVFINAYINGIFGEDTENCQGIVSNWMEKLAAEYKKNGKDFEAEQKASWTKIFTDTMVAQGTPATKKYPTLAGHANKSDFEGLAAYADRIDIAERVLKSYFVNINNKPIDTEALVKNIDAYLQTLVTDFDYSESELRDKEELFQMVKNAKGDKERTYAQIREWKLKKRLTHEPVSLIKYLNDCVAGFNNSKAGDKKFDVSEQKMALKFTESYIQESYDNFVNANKERFPQNIRVNVMGVDYTMSGAAEVAEFENKVKAKLDTKLEEDKKKAFDKRLLIGGAALAAVGVVFLFIQPVVGVIGLLGGAGLAGFGWKKRKDAIAALEKDYNAKLSQSKSTIAKIAHEWKAACNDVAAFENKPAFVVSQKSL